MPEIRRRWALLIHGASYRSAAAGGTNRLKPEPARDERENLAAARCNRSIPERIKNRTPTPWASGLILARSRRAYEAATNTHPSSIPKNLLVEARTDRVCHNGNTLAARHPIGIVGSSRTCAPILRTSGRVLHSLHQVLAISPYLPLHLLWDLQLSCM